MNHDQAEPLDPVVRLHVLAAALPGAVVAERTLAASFEQVWRVIADLETMLPRYENNVRSVDIIDRHEERAQIVVTLRGGHVEAMDVRIRPGWCVMQSESTVVAFGARSVGDRTVLAHLEHDRRASVIRDEPPSDTAIGKLASELDAIGSLAIELDDR